MDLNKDLKFIEIGDEDDVVSVSECQSDLGEDWGVIFLSNGLVVNNTTHEIARVEKLIASAISD